MKLIKIYIFIVLICLVFGVGNAYNHKLEDFKIDEVSYEEELKEEPKIDESKSEDITETKEVKTEEKKETTTKKNNNSSDSNKSNTSTPKKEEHNEPKQDTVPNNNSSESGVVDSNGNNLPEEHNVVVDKKPWEKAGVSEYDWYHKPVHNWMRVDYNVSNCNTVSNCEALCMKDAEELAYTENVSCIQVYSYSGNYLGEMLKRD